MDVVGVMATYLPVVRVCTALSRETLCVLHVCTALSREALSVLCVCTALSREALSVLHVCTALYNLINLFIYCMLQHNSDITCSLSILIIHLSYIYWDYYVSKTCLGCQMGLN